MKDKVINVVIAGLGGQGVLTASDILADAAFRAGYDVKKAEVHGMSQRGGSVSSDVRFGSAVLSPMSPRGEADYLVVLDPSQVEVNRACLSADGLLIESAAIDESALKNRRSLNVALLGVLSQHLSIDEEAWRQAIEANLKESIREVNLEAFEAGRAGE